MDEDSAVWNDSYSVGFAAIDNQHKKLVKMINELFQGCTRSETFAYVSFMQTVKNAVDYAHTHFKKEEDYMKRANYPALADHKKLHEEFIIEIAELVREFETGKTEPVSLARFLKKWLLNHIAVTDKKYAPYLTELK